MLSKLTKLSFQMALMLAGALFFTACSDDEDDNDQNNEEQEKNELSVQINGEAWTGDIGSVANTGLGRQINANNDEGTMIQLFFPPDTLGSFELTNTGDVAVSFNNGTATWSIAESGEFVLTENGSSIAGTFDAVLTSPQNSDTLVLSEGEFNWQ